MKEGPRRGLEGRWQGENHSDRSREALLPLLLAAGVLLGVESQGAAAYCRGRAERLRGWWTVGCVTQTEVGEQGM